LHAAVEYFTALLRLAYAHRRVSGSADAERANFGTVAEQAVIAIRIQETFDAAPEYIAAQRRCALTGWWRSRHTCTGHTGFGSVAEQGVVATVATDGDFAFTGTRVTQRSGRVLGRTIGTAAGAAGANIVDGAGVHIIAWRSVIRMQAHAGAAAGTAHVVGARVSRNFVGTRGVRGQIGKTGSA